MGKALKVRVWHRPDRLNRNESAWFPSTFFIYSHLYFFHSTVRRQNKPKGDANVSVNVSVETPMFQLNPLLSILTEVRFFVAIPIWTHQF